LEDRKPWGPLVATSADSVPSSNLVRITLAPIGTTFGNLQWRRYWNNFTFEYSSNNNIFSFVAMSADSIPSSKTNIFQSKLYTLIYCRHFRTYSRCAMFDWSDTVFRRRNVARRRISNTVLQPKYWGSEADSPEVCWLRNWQHRPHNAKENTTQYVLGHHYTLFVYSYYIMQVNSMNAPVCSWLPVMIPRQVLYTFQRSQTIIFSLIGNFPAEKWSLTASRNYLTEQCPFFKKNLSMRSIKSFVLPLR
jgi:hypothetical protein